MAEERYSSFLQQTPCDRPCRHPHRRLTGARALERIAHILETILDVPHQIGMSRTRHRHNPRGRCVFAGLYRHLVRPAPPVRILHYQRHRRSRRLAEAHTGEYLNLVRLDLHASAPAVPLLAPPELLIDELGRER